MRSKEERNEEKDKGSCSSDNPRRVRILRTSDGLNSIPEKKGGIAPDYRREDGQKRKKVRKARDGCYKLCQEDKMK